MNAIFLNILQNTTSVHTYNTIEICYILFSNPAHIIKILQHSLEIKCSYLYLSTKLNGKNDFDSSFIISFRLFFRSAFKIGNITSHLIWVYHPCGNTSNII